MPLFGRLAVRVGPGLARYGQIELGSVWHWFVGRRGRRGRLSRLYTTSLSGVVARQCLKMCDSGLDFAVWPLAFSGVSRQRGAVTPRRSVSSRYTVRSGASP